MKNVQLRRSPATARSAHTALDPDTAEPLPPVPAFSLLGMLSPLILVPALIPALVALFAPAAVLDRLP